MEKLNLPKVVASLMLGLTTLSANVYACSHNRMYVGNPNRPDTIWQPGYAENGCWHQGHYIKFIHGARCGDVAWVDGQYDKVGNWIPGHFKVADYHVVNPCPEYQYPGVPM